MVDAVRRVLVGAYGVPAPGVRRIPAGLATTNFVVETVPGWRLFVKVYRADADLVAENAAIQLGCFARSAGIPTAAVITDPDGKFIHIEGDVALSVWSFVDGQAGDAGPLDAARMQTIGAVLGRLHRRLAGYPGPVARRSGWCDVARAHAAIEDTVRRVRAAPHLEEPLRGWAVDVLGWRLAQLPRVAATLRALPKPVVQVLHGDCSPSNLIFHGDDVAAIVDFQPPTVRPLWWEIARIGCAQQSVLHDGAWVNRLGLLLHAYRRENDTVPAEDLLSVIRAARCFMTASVTPFDDLTDPQALAPTRALAAYAADRHAAVLALWEDAENHDEQLRQMLT